MTASDSPLVGQHLDMAYQLEHDRLRLFVRNMSDGASFWLTRRLTRALLRGLIDLLMRTSDVAARASADVRGDVLLFEHVGAITRRIPVETPAAIGQAMSAPGQNDGLQVHLLQQVDLKAVGDRVTLSLMVEGNCAAIIPMSRDNAHQLIGMLYDRARIAGWDLAEFVWLDRRGHFVIPENLAPS